MASKQPTESSAPQHHPQATEQPAIFNPNPKPTTLRNSATIPITRTEAKIADSKRNAFDVLREIFFGGKKEQFDRDAGLSTTVNLIGASYLAHVTIGSQVLPLLVDTGSSDLWVASSDFHCLEKDGQRRMETPSPSEAANVENEGNKCKFPMTYANPNVSGGFVPDEYFSIRYGNGQFLYGSYGVDDVSLGGITVPNQRIALPTAGYFKSSTGDFAGILGLAYPAMVAARKGATPKEPPPPPSLVLGSDTVNDGYEDNEEKEGRKENTKEEDIDEFGEYDTWFFNAVQKGLTKPLFSLALDVDGGGLLRIGEVVDVAVEGEFWSTPILKVNLVGEPRAADNFTFYTIMADDYILDGIPFSQVTAHDTQPRTGDNATPDPPSFPVVVDSGWTTNVLPPSLVSAFYDTFPDPKPQPVVIDGETLFAVPCGVMPPSFGVKLGGSDGESQTVLEMHAESIVISRLNTTNTVMNDDGVTEKTVSFCALGLQPGVEFAGVLGDAFLSSVVAVFDVEEGEMRFAQRRRGGLDGAQGREEL
ncbi:aspartic peptidase domain-containing protein [Coniella lustricola]|uniref:Aspartic peptidase domain-containing protein n=1 Tax=Coniella lustricola TaxID=2025994 RepID=A0A2T3A610_9PEZI|nr:aspartic peptidase domain-containing protein [Coniella lustricola]